MDILKRELKILLHERRIVLFVLMAAATAYALLIGNLYSGQSVQKIPVMVCDRDESALSRQLIADISMTDQYDFQGMLTDEAAVDLALREKRATAVFLIPEDFSTQFYKGGTPTICFLQNGTNVLENGYASLPAQLLAAKWTAAYRSLQNVRQATPELTPVTVGLDLRYTGNTAQSYLLFYIYGVILVAAQLSVTLSYGLSIQGDAGGEYFSRKGIPRVMAIKIILYWVMSTLALLDGISLLLLLFAIPMKGSILQTVLLLSLFLLAVENLAGLLALYFRTKLALVQCLVFIALPSFLMAGYIWPQEATLQIVQWITYLLPVHYAALDFRQLALTGLPTANYSQHLLILLLMSLGGMAGTFGWLCRRQRPRADKA
ncbi:MAG: ABC transporter permease [Selenomonas sp.]|uniref:ABC transporter permease n=1 Tax=Selenomonas sp. TaxID=2053611 RepID=UPI0025D4C978|nr:ABC transporter permease [Selenomonas sp.]MCR5758228.1 ABC transporter permease [Selenomonas sp.]